MGIKDRAMEKVLGGVTGKAVKGLVPLLESIHTRLELQNELLKEILRHKFRENSSMSEEDIENEIKRVEGKVVE